MTLITSKYRNDCSACGEPIAEGDKVDWVRGVKGVRCERCFKTAAPPMRKAEPKLRDNQSLRIDCLARELPARALEIAERAELGQAEQMKAAALQLVVDLSHCLKDGDYELRLVIPDRD